MVDIEIVDTRNGNESQLVTAGEGACSCDSADRAELADASHFAGSNPRAAPPSPHREMRRVASAGNIHGGGGGGGGGMRRVPSSQGLRRNPSAGRLYDYGGGNGGAHPTHSRGSGGSDLFDALLMAATGDHDVRSHGEPPVSSRAAPNGGGALGGGATAAATGGVTGGARRPGSGGVGVGVGHGSRAWLLGSHNDLQDSLQNAVEALKGAAADDGDDGGVGGLARLGSGGVGGGNGGGGNGGGGGSGLRGRRSMARRNSVSMIVENPVLAQTGAGDSLIVGQQYYQAYLGGIAGGIGGGGGDGGEYSVEGEGEGEGDTDHGGGDHGDTARGGVGIDGQGGGQQGGQQGGDDLLGIRAVGAEGMLRQFNKQHSAVNLSRLGGGAAADVRRLQDELRQVREEAKALGVLLEESKSAHKAAERTAEESGAVCRLAADSIQQLRAVLVTLGIADPTLALQSSGGGEEGLRTSEQEIELLKLELADVKTTLSKVQAEKKEVEGNLRAANTAAAAAAAAVGSGLPRGNGMPPPSATAAAAAVSAFHMPYAMGMLPMFGMPPLNPYGGIQGLQQQQQQPHNGGGGGGGGGAAAAAVPSPIGGNSAFRPIGSMQKVASMPAMHHNTNMMSPPADRDAKRKADSPPTVAAAAGDEQQLAKKHAVEGVDGAPAAATTTPKVEEDGGLPPLPSSAAATPAQEVAVAAQI